MLSSSCGAPENHRPKLLNRSWVFLVEATSSQNSGRRKYARAASMAIVSGVLRRGDEAADRRRFGAVGAGSSAGAVVAFGMVVVTFPSFGSR